MKLGTLALAAVFFLPACATGPVLPPGSACVVNVPRAPFYKYGPAQSFGADMMLEHGTQVSVIERSMGYVRVMTQNGFTGYVSGDHLDPLPPATPKKEPERVVTNRKLPRVFSAPVKRSNVAPTPGDPLFDMNDVPLPVQDEPKPAAPPPATAPPPTN